MIYPFHFYRSFYMFFHKLSTIERTLCKLSIVIKKKVTFTLSRKSKCYFPKYCIQS